MQTIDELKYSQSVWGFQPRKAEIRRVCDVKGLLRNRNHLDVCKDRFRQRCQIVPLVRKTLKCPDCGTRPCDAVNVYEPNGSDWRLAKSITITDDPVNGILSTPEGTIRYDPDTGRRLP